MEQTKESKQNNYFDDTTQQAILDFQSEPDIEEKKRIFVKRIQPSFSKLIENVIFVYKFHNLGSIESLKNDCLSFLFENLYKFDGTKGSKAFSYFNVMAKNWFIQRVKIFKKKNKSDIPFDKSTVVALEKEYHEMAVISYEDEALKSEFLDLLKEEIKKWRDKFDKAQEKKVLEAIILLFENPDIINIYNKKGVYLYLREICGLNTNQIVTNLAKLKRKYSSFKRKYHTTGEV